MNSGVFECRQGPPLKINLRGIGSQNRIDFLAPVFDYLRLSRNHAVGNRGAGVSPEAFLPKLIYDSITAGKPIGELRPNASMENDFGRDARATVRALPLHGHG
jgi:hypothetical protein